MTATYHGGAVAAGHRATAEAAAEILQDGGTAFDAAIAALAAACIAEPVLASLGGGGFLLARDDGGRTLLFDFFPQTPKWRRPPADVDFRPITADFGPATQIFHIGMGTAATPGTVRGMFAVHRELCRLPLSRLVEPAVRLARDGVAVNRLQAFVARIVSPILLASPAGQRRFGRPDAPDEPMAEGQHFRWPELQDVLETLAREGDRLFYEGEIAGEIVRASQNGGGHITRDDLRHYRVIRRRPLVQRFAGTRVLTNPPPSAGGMLIAFTLSLMDAARPGPSSFGSPGHLGLIARALSLTHKARHDCRMREDPDGAFERLFDPALLASYRAQVAGHPSAHRGTTHVSILDRRGNAVAMTLSNGEGCGVLVATDGFMLNNMLGEDDINPDGAEGWPTDTRLSSMMAPTLAEEPGGGLTVLGSGGSNRIRSAIAQTLINLYAFDLPLADAIDSPRLHVEDDHLDIEAGFDDGAVRAVTGGMDDCRVWPEPNLYFGGVNAVRADGRDRLTGHADPRRGGAVVVF